MARLFYIAAQEIKQIIVNLGAEPRNSGSLGWLGCFLLLRKKSNKQFQILGQSPEMEEPGRGSGCFLLLRKKSYKIFKNLRAKPRNGGASDGSGLARCVLR